MISSAFRAASDSSIDPSLPERSCRRLDRRQYDKPKSAVVEVTLRAVAEGEAATAGQVAHVASALFPAPSAVRLVLRHHLALGLHQLDERRFHARRQLQLLGVVSNLHCSPPFRREAARSRVMFSTPRIVP